MATAYEQALRDEYRLHLLVVFELAAGCLLFIDTSICQLGFRCIIHKTVMVGA
jgi:hypothetical protein